MATITMNDPSYAVHRDLLPHVHLLSTFRYPHKAQVQPAEVTSWLMQAPKIARDTAPFFWTYIEKPENGQIFLTWQPLQLMGPMFASDGFIWPAQEQFFTQEVGNGVILEMYYHKAGYANGESLATHSRRRFHLVPPHAPNPNAPQVDPSLWIVHYGPIENNERIPAQAIMRDPRTPAIMETRAYLQRCGQIQRKEFILSDRVNWPQVAWPREPPRQPMYPAGRGVPQTIAYPPHAPAPAPGPPPKRPRTNQAAHSQLNEPVFEDDEDTSRGDLFDIFTPRDVSISRYKQNHEWMEEILSSAYRMSQIGFTDLGLGLKGELASLTEGIFDTQDASTTTQPQAKPATTHLDAEQAAEFRKRVNDKINSTKAEIEKMEADHARQMARFRQNSLITASEKELRTAVDDSTTETLRLEGKDEPGDSPGRWPAKHPRKVDDIVSQVEAHLNRRAEVIHDLRRIQQGGYQEPTPEPVIQADVLQASTIGGPVSSANGSNAMSRQPSHAGSQQSGFMMGDSDVDMGGTAAGLLDQMHTGASFNSTPQPPMSAPSNAATPANLNIPSPHPPPPHQHNASTHQNTDVRMDGMDTTSGTAPDHGAGTGDWVVVPKGGVTPDANADAGPPRAVGPSSKQPSAAGTPSAGFNGDPNDFSSLEDLNSAGDALAGFSGTPGGMSEGLDLNMEDSAFGDAFHGVDTQGGGGTPADNTI
ncbi:putative SWI SNF and RSC complexes subunit ssr4 [Rosellinia necatrix]|uniref:Putative SWI SNF and RSC complexes subunit ssr4 n=1 Tax=Rosellinia necatrix TaxID=77044 RepID=A0A1W2TB01_ROSNE|nr:putative SWI SNF and RSC complexes subunit ssr4 [Rosellinia necatrix]